jgi:hypothetical protein
VISNPHHIPYLHIKNYKYNRIFLGGIMAKEFDIGTIINVRFPCDFSLQMNISTEVVNLYEYLIGAKLKSLNLIAIHKKCVNSLKEQVPFYEELGIEMSKFRSINKYDTQSRYKYMQLFTEKMREKYKEPIMLEPISKSLSKIRR